MQTTTKTILWVAGTAVVITGAVLYVRNQAVKITESDVQVTGIRLISFEKNVITLEVTIVATNNSSVTATLQEIYMDVLLQNKKVGVVQFTADTSSKDPAINGFIAAKSKTAPIPILVNVNVEEIAGNIFGMLFGTVQSKNIVVQLDGYATIKKGMVSVNIPINYTEEIKL